MTNQNGSCSDEKYREFFRKKLENLNFTNYNKSDENRLCILRLYRNR